jgi:tRNA modification GTPase
MRVNPIMVHQRMRVTDTIAACSTSPGVGGALAIVRISGPQAIPIVGRYIMLSGGVCLDQVLSHTVRYATFVASDGAIVDRCMVTVFRAPRTFTGYDTVELSLHNNTLIIDAVLDLLYQAGARPAQAGEFTRQAVMQGKIDLIQAEGIHDIITATSLDAVRAAQEQTAGTLSHEIQTIYEQIIKALAWTEASFEFLDDEGDFGVQVEHIISALLIRLHSFVQLYTHQQPLRRGMRIALIGTVNAGKSSLLNQLVGSKRAIVCDIAGTTRDTIEVPSKLAGITVVYVDTAGIRATQDIIEREGIERSYEQAAIADVTVLMYDVWQKYTDSEIQELYQLAVRWPERVIVLGTKIDQLSKGIAVPPALGLLSELPVHYICTTDVQDVDMVKKLLTDRITALTRSAMAPYLLNQRHIDALTLVIKELEQVQILLKQDPAHVAYELVAYHLKQAGECISGLLGASVSEQVLDKVFKDFCVGK